MAGSGTRKRSRALAVRAYKLARQGFTNRQIAAAVGKDVKAIPEMVRVGERFADDPKGTP